MKIIEKIFGKKKILKYPNDFAIVDFSSIALEEGISDNHNKIITRYYIDRYGFLNRKRYRYSREMVYILENISKIPVYDKTIVEQRFPIFSKLLPSEVEYE